MPVDETRERARREGRVKLAWLVGGGVVALHVIACCFGGGEHAQEIARLAAACDGAPVPGAPPYVAGPGPHPMMALQRGASSGRWSQGFGMLTTRTPSGHDVASTQLVLCVEPATETVVGECAFDTQLRVGLVPVPGTRSEGPTFQQVQVSQRTRIVAVATGQTVAETTLQGSAPPACDHPILGEPSAADFRGGDVGSFTINQWAEPYGLGTAP